MKKEKVTKIRLLKIFEILKQETDEDNFISSVEIIHKLKEQNIDCDRRTLYNDINLLIEYNYDIIINKEPGKSNYYCLLEKDLSIPEIHILLDAIQASNFISQSKTDYLIDKISNFGGNKKSSILKSNIIYFNNNKTKNEQIMYSINEIISAIENNKKISFNYYDYDEHNNKVYRNEKKTYYINPLATVFSNDNYYLIGYYKKYAYQTIHYRIDRMDNVEMCDQEKDEFLGENIDFHNRKKQLFGMFQGADVEVEFEIDKSILDPIYDKFGYDINLIESEANKYRFTAIVQVSPTFFGWCFMFGDKLKLLNPKNVVNDYCNSVKEVYNTYK